MEKIYIQTEWIRLDQLLKFSGLCSTGGESKMLITEGFVTVNHETCEQRGKKIRNGDTVCVDCPELNLHASFEIEQEQ